MLVALGAVLPFTAGPALARALAPTSTPVRTLASVGLWAAWALGLLAAVVAHPLALTALRVLSPAGAAAVIMAVSGHGADLPALVSVLLAAAWAFAPAVGARAVNGPAYGDERRFPLRPPGALWLGPALLAWALAVAGMVAGPLMLAARIWVPGAVAVLSGVPLSLILLRALHSLSRRWAVFVPAGMVLHDPLTLADPVLFRRGLMSRLGAADAGTDALDLTQRAPGLALELTLVEEIELALMRPGRGAPETRRARAVLFTPTRPGALLGEARRRRLPAGEPAPR